MNRTIKTNKDVPIDELLRHYEYDIFNSAFESMKRNYKTFDGEELNVINIQTESSHYSINLTRKKFNKWLNNCIKFFEDLEEYEKCKECLDILNYLNHNNKKNKH